MTAKHQGGADIVYHFRSRMIPDSQFLRPYATLYL